jgi:hypothetical protein
MSHQTFLHLLLPQLALSMSCLLGPAIAFLLSVKPFLQRDSPACWRYAVGSTSASLFVAFFVADFLWGPGGQRSTAGLVFLFLPAWGCAIAFLVPFLFWLFAKSRAHQVTTLPVGTAETTTPKAAHSRPSRAFALAAACLLGVGALLVFASIRDLKMAAAESPHTPVVELRHLFEAAQAERDEDDGVLLFLAGNRNTPSDILALLCTSRFEAVRVHAAGNPATPSESLEMALSDCNDYVKNAAQANLASRK